MSLDMNIKKDFGGFTLELDIQAGNEVLALLGASGCGKSMTLKCISGIVTPDEGYIRVNDRVLFDSEQGINLAPQERHVGLLFQNYALFPNMNVTQNILTGMNGLDISKEEKHQRAADMISKFYLNGLEKHRPSQLSGGQQQRVALARIMVSNPSILMLDEPFSALDSFLRWELEQELMKVLEDFDGTSIIVSHSRDEVYRISDHIAVISDGRKDCYGDKESLFDHPPTYQSAILTGYRNFSRAEYIDENHIRAIDWNTVIRCKAEKDVSLVGLRPEHIHISEKEDQESTATFRVAKAIDNLGEIILLLTTKDNTGDMIQEAGSGDFTWLNVSVMKDEYRPFRDSEYIHVPLNDENILQIRAQA